MVDPDYDTHLERLRERQDELIDSNTEDESVDEDLWDNGAGDD